MDSYPGDLLAGVFPLVFAVNAILPGTETTSTTPQADAVVVPSNDSASTSIMQDQPPPPPPLKNRGLFDKFLDAMAASLADEEEEQDETHTRNESTTRVVPSFLGNHNNNSSSSSDDSDQDEKDKVVKPIRSFGSPTFRITHTRLGVLRGSIRSNQVDTPLSTAYARSLQLLNDEGFFQRARIISISARHGFPPSKDPQGSALRHTSTSSNVQGILPAGWMEKHVHALPSVLVVVTLLDFSTNEKQQQQQDEYLVETIEHLRYSLAPKRECRIQLVCLASNVLQDDDDDDEAAVATVEEWVTDVMTRCHLHASCITVLDSKNDLECSIPTSFKTRQLHKTVRDASMAYYLGQARRVKHKLAALQPQEFVLHIRYCFKIGILYEFLLKHEKSTKYLAQAYRHLEHYYRYYILSTPPLPVVVNPQEQQQDSSEGSNEGSDSGVEVSLLAKNAFADSEESNDDEKKKKSDTPADMAFQCRALADWLNLKLLQSGFLSAAFSSENPGLVAAASQWRRHCMTFLSLHDEKKNPLWNHLRYNVHQRTVMAQLVERQSAPLKEQLDAEVSLQLSAWRKYQSTAQAMLKLGIEMEEAKESANLAPPPPRPVDDDKNKSMRPRFVGSIDSEGLVPKFHEECKRNHKELALELILHAVSLFENERKKAASDEEETQCRAATQMYYLAGGILMELKRFGEAIPLLEKASKHAAGWNELEVVIRRMLIECYEQQLSSQDMTEEQRKNVTNLILDSYFYSKLPLKSLEHALNHVSTMTGRLSWHGECTNNAEEQSLPFSFLVTFPGSTHATAGDVVVANVTIKSNLDHDVHVSSATLLSMAGKIEIPCSDLHCAEGAHSGDGKGGIVMRAKSTIFVSTMIDVPKDVDSIATDESGNGGDKEGSPGKGSFSKSARPRASGLTAAGGARLIDERTLNRNDGKNSNAQWSLGYLGGKPLRCDGMSLEFYPLAAEKAAGPVVEFRVTHMKPKTQAPVKKTPFEEDNYISSAWSRPRDLPLSLGPRCLRVLGPMAQMVVTNMSNPLTNGTAMEGTVNRVLIKLQAGPKEECADIKYKVACSNTLLSIDGTSSASHDSDDPVPSFEAEEKVDDRTPVLVTAESSTCDYDLPEGWQLVGSGQGTIQEVVPESSRLRAGESTYIYLDLYRPPPQLKSPFAEDIVETNDICQTDFDVAITYRQARPSAQLRRRISDVSSVDDGKEAEKELSDLVFLEYSGSVVWAPPISADFSNVVGGQKSFPSGSSHKSNMVDTIEDSGEVDNDTTTPGTQQPSELALVDGQRVSAGCVIVSNAVNDALSSEIERVSFENNDGHVEGNERSCDLRLVSDCKDDALYCREGDNAGSKLVQGTKFSVTYTVEAHMSESSEESSAFICLGVVCVDWKPTPLTLEGDDSIAHAHGPLVLERPSRIKYWGPRCYIEKAPFEASLDSLPPSPRLSVPFDVSFRITNNTQLYQKLTVAMSDADCSDVSDGLLLSGLVNGEICLAPQETQVIWYTALATRAGKMQMPAISVSALRYKTWVINHGVVDAFNIFVVP